MGPALGAVLTAWLLLTAAGCKHGTSATNTNSNIYISNDCGATVRIFLDGALEATTDSGDNATITSVAEGDHLFEAKMQASETVILSKTLNIEPDSTNTVTIYGVATIRVTNNYPEIVHIYDADDEDNYIGDVGVNVSLIIPHITFGTHNYTAQRMSDAAEVATFTVVVADVAEYLWTINP
ncbi:MAG: hypothetical protein ABFD80_12480 [Acidobacteriota bacterium]